MNARLGMAGLVRCGMVGVAVAVLAAGFGAAGAWASPLHTPRALAAAQDLPGMAPAATEFDQPSAILATAPIRLKIHGVVYDMQIVADQDLGSPSSKPTLAVALDGEQATSDQAFAYTFSPSSGITFSFAPKTGARAAVSAASAIAPSAIKLTYTATDHESFPCTLQDGGKGHMAISSGTVAFSAFSFVTRDGQFGTITKQPKKATFSSDPGCGGTVRVVHICSGPETVAVGHFGSQQEWYFGELQLGDKRPLEGVVDDSAVSPTETLESFGTGLMGKTDLPAPTAGPSGATATVRTSGNPLMTGTASFTSTGAPKISTGRCRDENGGKHTYTMSTYTGTLSSGSPLLTVNFVTGALAFPSPQAARLYLTTYTS